MSTNKEFWLELHKEKRHQPKYPNDDIVAFTFRNFSRDGKILDLGCGAGRHLKFLAENGYKAYGCDYSSNGIEASKYLLDTYALSAELEVASVDNLPYEDNFFDGIISCGVLYYNPKDIIEKSAQEIYRVLKKGHKAYIVIRSLEDYRYQNAIKKTKYEVVINETDESKHAFKENGMNMYFFDKEEVERVFYMFKNIEINTLIRTYAGDTYKNHDYVIVLEK